MNGGDSNREFICKAQMETLSTKLAGKMEEGFSAVKQ